MMMQVMPRRRIDRMTWASVTASSALVASSMMRIVGSCTRARAISRRWRWPPEKSRPPSSSLCS